MPRPYRADCEIFFCYFTSCVGISITSMTEGGYVLNISSISILSIFQVEKETGLRQNVFVPGRSIANPISA